MFLFGEFLIHIIYLCCHIFIYGGAGVEVAHPNKRCCAGASLPPYNPTTLPAIIWDAPVKML
jgi:hypothetical protein